jgi:sugar lactone lactonase YvrE
MANIPNEGLTGIEWNPETDEIVGGQWIQGSLVAVGPDGALREIVSGNGLVTPMSLAFSPCGELAMPSDEGGMMTLINSAGTVSKLFEYISYGPPAPFVAFDPDGTLYASEGEPMLQTPKRIIVAPPGESPRTLVEADLPSGLARRADGVLFVAETGAGCIIQVNPDGTATILVDGLDYPSALALDADGNLYVVVGPADHVPDEAFPVPGEGDTIMRITPEGERTVPAQVDFRTHFATIAIGPEGDLFATMPDAVVRVTDDGGLWPLASGFKSAQGLAFDLAGNLYVSDDQLSAIVRISGFPQGTLSGVVNDPSGAPVAGARVQVLTDQPIIVGQVVTTDTDGRFSLLAAPCVYTVIATAEGYETKTVNGNTVTADQETILEIELEG